MMSEKLQIRYSGFQDFPLALTVRWKERLYGFLREFDEMEDDYEDRYRVFFLPQWTDEEIEVSWDHLERHATEHLGEVSVSSILFDSTHRREIDSAILQTLAMLREAVGVMR